MGDRLRGLWDQLWPLHRKAGVPGVPAYGSRDLPPPGAFRLASEYLLSRSRMKRREITIDAYLTGTDERTVDVECVLPAEDIGQRDWYLPVAFLERGDVAPFLRVTDCEGALIPIPTKQQNMALTRLAIDELLEAEGIELGSAESRQLIDEVITRLPFNARTCRYKFEEEEPEAAPRLKPLLGLLEDHFLLWVPVRGAPLSPQHFSIKRRQIRIPDELFRRKARTSLGQVKTALGFVQVRWKASTGRWALNSELALERLLHTFALRPVEAYVDELEASRFASCHLCFRAPGGFLVRYIKSAEVLPGKGGSPSPPRRLSRHQRHVAIQGYDRELAHVHLSKARNPDHIHTRLTLSLRGGITTLWMLATVLTAGLLWVVHHHSFHGAPVPHLRGGHPRLVFDASVALLATAHQHAKHVSFGANNRQIAAAALLVGPAFASAWSLRAEGSDLLRSSLAGSRVLLLLSAALSVATALALADILPTAAAGRYEAVEIYAAASYVVAVPMVVAWLLSSRPVWVLFRSLLRSEEHNLQAVVLAGVPILAVGLLPFAPGRIDGAVLLACGLVLAAVSANSVGEPLFKGRTLYRPLAGYGCLLPLFFAGDFLGFYADRIPAGVACMVCTGVGATLIGEAHPVLLGN